MCKRLILLVAILVWTGTAQAVPINLSFQGSFSQDDDVQLFNFTTDGSSTVYLVSYGYGGGTQADGSVVSAGGLDTILTLFDAAGNFITANDDGSSGCFAGAAGAAPGSINGNSDPNTGRRWDTCLSAALAAGIYTVAVTQYDNFANGDLADGFFRDGQGNFTAGLGGCSNGIFCDVSGADPYNNRTGAWAYDILNVESAEVIGVPEPGTLALLGIGLFGIGMARRKKA